MSGDTAVDIDALTCQRIEVDKESLVNFSGISKMEWYHLEVHSVPNSKNLSENRVINERVGHALLSYDKSKKIFMIGGGNHSGDLQEIWTIDYSSGTGPLMAVLHPTQESFQGRYEFLCASNGNGQSWIFGGADFQLPRNDVLQFNLEEETMVVVNEGGEEIDVNVPAPRTQGNNTCFLDIKGKECFAVFGGGQKGETSVPDGNIYLYNIAENEWTRVDVKNKTPDPVQGHAMVSIGTKVYVHAGMQKMNFYDDLHMIDLAMSEPSWIKLSPNGERPCARAAHSICPIASNEFIIYGGLGDDGALADMWRFNTESNEWTEIKFAEGKPSPSPRFDFAMTHLRVQAPEATETSSMLLIHGGMNTEGELFKDFWVYPLSI